MLAVVSTPLAGVVVLEPQPLCDERGMFARTWDAEHAAEHGLDPSIAECSTSYNRHRGTLRGLHLQRDPWQETKVVRCTAGAVFDVAIDLRPLSSSYLKWFGVELAADNRRSLVVPPGCAHGFITLRDESEVFYQISVPHHPESAAGYLWDDPAFSIDWPISPVLMSDKDRSWPRYAVATSQDARAT